MAWHPVTISRQQTSKSSKSSRFFSRKYLWYLPYIDAAAAHSHASYRLNPRRCSEALSGPTREFFSREIRHPKKSPCGAQLLLLSAASKYPISNASLLAHSSTILLLAPSSHTAKPEPTGGLQG